MTSTKRHEPNARTPERLTPEAPMRYQPWLLLLTIPLLLTACERRPASPAGESASSAGATAGKLRVAMMPKLVGIDYFNACKQGAEEAARELGDVDLQYDGPTEAKVDKQVEMLDTWIAQRVSAIAIACDD